MFKNWVLYLLSWLVCIIFYCAYQQWFAWIALLILLVLPLFSLLCSLPAMLSGSLTINAPEVVTTGDVCHVNLGCKCPFPTPLWRCSIQVEHPMTGKTWELANDGQLPTNHCGVRILHVEKARIYDYLGLFALPLRGAEQFSVTVRPQPIPMALPNSSKQGRALRWQGKPGGGYSENHELRLYRPGDSTQQIHWKLSAKTGRLILREPQIPVGSTVTLRLNRGTTPGEADRATGRLLYVSQQLLAQGLRLRILCQGTSLPANSPEELLRSVDALLAMPLSCEPATQSGGYWIGGDLHET